MSQKLHISKVDEEKGENMAKESWSDMTQDAGREKADRGNAKEAAADKDRAAGDTPDSAGDAKAAQEQADWDAAEDHVDNGGKATK